MLVDVISFVDVLHFGMGRPRVLQGSRAGRVQALPEQHD